MSVFPEYVTEILDKLRNSSCQAYAVGGCVRDMIMGRVPHDYDITTNAVPERIKQIFSNSRIVTAGEKHGTIGVVSGGHMTEITAYRIDGAYTDSRRPDSVIFSDNIEDDLKRRDFTMNAMAMDINGDIIDIFGGKDDIKKGIIRAVGEPDKRIEEDALRIMRCVRFASELGFMPEQKLCFSIEKNKELLKNISAERIREEFVKLLCGQYSTEVLRSYSSIIEVFIPEIRKMYGFEQLTKYHRYDVWEHTIHAVSGGDGDPLICTALFFHDIAKPNCRTIDADGTGHFKGHADLSALKAAEIMKRLRFSSSQIKNAAALIGSHRYRLENDAEIKHIMGKIGAERFPMLIKLKKADDSAKGYYDEDSKRRLEAAAKRCAEIIDNGECYRISDLEINGNDLMALGVNGRRIREILEHLLSEVIEGKVKNNKKELIKCAKSII